MDFPDAGVAHIERAKPSVKRRSRAYVNLPSRRSATGFRSDRAQIGFGQIPGAAHIER
jgi:hypothetical protein